MKIYDDKSMTQIIVFLLGLLVCVCIIGCGESKHDKHCRQALDGDYAIRISMMRGHNLTESDLINYSLKHDDIEFKSTEYLRRIEENRVSLLNHSLKYGGDPRPNVHKRDRFVEKLTAPQGTSNLLNKQAVSTTGSYRRSDRVKVRGYYRKDGTYVRPHTRSYPIRRK